MTGDLPGMKARTTIDRNTADEAKDERRAGRPLPQDRTDTAATRSKYASGVTVEPYLSV